MTTQMNMSSGTTDTMHATARTTAGTTRTGLAAWWETFAARGLAQTDQFLHPQHVDAGTETGTAGRDRI